MARIKSDFTETLEAAIDGRLDQVEIEWDRRTALGVVLAAHGYPDDPRKGDPITGLPPRGNPGDADCLVFHAGTTKRDSAIETHGGRGLCVTGLGDSVKVAQSRAYQTIDGIRFDGMQFRRDIGYRAIGRKR
jgi:phosphoribosylamine---glycine ligase